MFIFVRRRTENTTAICEKTAGLRSGNFSDLNSACSKMLVTVKIFQFHDMLKEGEKSFLRMCLAFVYVVPTGN